MENQEEKTCRKCKKILTTRTRRPFWVKYLLFWLPIKRFKCNFCGKRTYLFGTYSRRRKAWS